MIWVMTALTKQITWKSTPILMQLSSMITSIALTKIKTLLQMKKTQQVYNLEKLTLSLTRFCRTWVFQKLRQACGSLTFVWRHAWCGCECFCTTWASTCCWNCGIVQWRLSTSSGTESNLSTAFGMFHKKSLLFLRDLWPTHLFFTSWWRSTKLVKLKSYVFLESSARHLLGLGFSAFLISC